MNNRAKIIFLMAIFIFTAAFFFLPFIYADRGSIIGLFPDNKPNLNLQVPSSLYPSVIEVKPTEQTSNLSSNKISSVNNPPGEQIAGEPNTSSTGPMTETAKPPLNDTTQMLGPSTADNSADSTYYRAAMVNLISSISSYAKAKNNSFQLISNNGLDLLQRSNGNLGETFFDALDAVNLESLFWGWNMRDDARTPISSQQELLKLTRQASNKGIPVFNIDYAKQKTHIDESYQTNAKNGIIPFIADSRLLDSIPAYPSQIFGKNDRNVTTMTDAQNFLCLINPQLYGNKEQYLKALSNTDYDVLIIDLCFWDEPLLKTDVNRLKGKKNGGKRLVIAYMSIGEAEDYRVYWQDQWSDNPPHWIAEENEDWEGNFKVRYWEKAWHTIVYQGNDSYVNKIIEAGFDGVFLDVIDAYQYFEEAR